MRREDDNTHIWMLLLDDSPRRYPVGVATKLNVHQEDIGIQVVGSFDCCAAIGHRLHHFQVRHGAQGYFKHIPEQAFILDNHDLDHCYTFDWTSAISHGKSILPRLKFLALSLCNHKPLVKSRSQNSTCRHFFISRGPGILCPWPLNPLGKGKGLSPLSLWERAGVRAPPTRLCTPGNAPGGLFCRTCPR